MKKLKYIKLFEAFNTKNIPWTWNGNSGFLCYIDGSSEKHTTKLNKDETYRDVLNRVEEWYRREYGMGKPESMPAGGFKEDTNIWIDESKVEDDKLLNPKY